MNQQIKQRIEQIERGEIPTGYKSTLVGIVPVEWEEKKLSDITSKIGSGKTPLGGEAVYKEQGIALIRSQNVLSGGFTFENLAFIDEETHKSMKSSITQENDILFNITGASIGRCCVIPNDLIGSNLNQHVCIIRCKNQNSYYVSLLLNDDVGQKYIDSFQCGGGRQGLNFQQIGSFSFVLPTLPEQNRIAEILSTQDRAIELQEKVIVQKEEQKKYLMQVLLTGKKRLKGFNGKWEEKKLGEIVSITTGKLDANAMAEEGAYPFFTCAKEVFKIDTYAFDTEAILISGNGANVGYVHYYKGKFNAYQRTYVLTKMKENVFFLKFLLDENLSTRINKEKHGGNTPYIVLSALSQMKLKFPPLPEQEAIAEILSSADKEIELLKKQLEHEKQKKKTLMQLLLTGIVRV